jgi:hypothetical protein
MDVKEKTCRRGRARPTDALARTPFERHESRTTPLPDKIPPTVQRAVPSPNRKRPAHISWYGAILIASMLAVAAGWEFFRVILAIITMD